MANVMNDGREEEVDCGGGGGGGGGGGEGGGGEEVREVGHRRTAIVLSRAVCVSTTIQNWHKAFVYWQFPPQISDFVDTTGHCNIAFVSIA